MKLNYGFILNAQSHARTFWSTIEQTRSFTADRDKSFGSRLTVSRVSPI